MPLAQSRPSIDKARALFRNGRIEKYWPKPYAKWYAGTIVSVDDVDSEVPDGLYFNIHYDDDDDSEDIEWEELIGEGVRLSADLRDKAAPLIESYPAVEQDRGKRAAATAMPHDGINGGGSGTQPLQRQNSNKRTADDAAAPLRGPKKQAVPAGGKGRAPKPRDTSLSLQHYLQKHQLPEDAVRDWFGHVKSVRIVNFMCHEHFEIEMGPNVNFVSGQNGSGKSAILQAMQVCLGVAARQTGRGKSVKDYIRTGTTQAKVWVTVWNTGNEAVDPDKYGAWITFHRTITPSSASFKIFNQWNEEVGRGGRDAVDSLLETLNIDAANPMVCMTQDTARSFASTKSPTELFTLYEDSLQFSATLEHINAASSNYHEAKARCKAAGEALEEKRQELKGMEERLRLMRDHAKWDEQAKDLQHYALAEEVRKLRDGISRIDKWLAGDYSSWQGQYADLRAQAAAELEAAQVLQAEQAAKVDQFTPALEALQLDISDASKAVKAARRAVTAAEYALGSLEAEAERTRAEAQQLKEQHTAELQDVVQQTQAVKENYEATRKAKETAVDAAKVAATDARSAAAESRAAFEQAARVVQQAETAHTDCLNRQQQIDAELRRLEGRGGQNAVRNFGGAQMEALTQLVAAESRQGRFRRPPCGPLGAHLSLRDDKWGTAIEAAVGGILFEAWLVDNLDDAALLKRLAAQARCRAFRVFVLKYDIPEHNVGSRAVTGVDTLLSELVVKAGPEGKLHVLRNVLIDQCNAERCPLASGEAEGLSLLRSYPPRTIAKVWCADGGQCYTRGRSTTFVPLHRTVRSRLVRDLSAVKAQVQAEFQEAKAATDAAQQQVQAARARANQLKEEMKRMHTARKAAERQQMVAESQLSETCALGPRFAPEVHSAEDESNAMAERLQELMNDVAVLERQIAEKRAAVEELRAEAERQAATKDAKTAEMQRLIYDNEAVVDGLAAKARDVQAKEAALAALEAEKQDTEAAKAQSLKRKSKLEADLAAATRGGDALTDEAHEALQARVFEAFPALPSASDRAAAAEKEERVLQGRMKAYQDQAGSVSWDELQAEEMKLKRVVNLQEMRYRQAADAVKRLKNGLNLRWHKFQEMRSDYRDLISAEFNRYLARKGWSGSMLINQDAGTLELKVRTDAKRGVTDLKALSGGERSFTTLCFMMSVGSQIGSPFHAMDEFDVFMDPIVRRKSMSSLISLAWAFQQTQFIFLSPQQLDQVKQAAADAAHRELAGTDAPDFPKHFLKVHVMKPARESA